MIRSGGLQLLFLSLHIVLALGNKTTDVSVFCRNEHLYDNLDISEILGRWNVMEVYMHISREGIIFVHRCPVVTIWLPSNRQLHHVEALNAQFRQLYRYLRLLWDEEGQTVEYALYFTNNSAGYWQAFDGQNGTLSHRTTYRQFTGTVQVLKAVNDHLVLNFCQEATNGKSAELYSVLFSREPRSMTRWEVESVHSLLQNKNLSVASRRLVCGNSADTPSYSVLLSFLTCLFAYIICAS